MSLTVVVKTDTVCTALFDCAGGLQEVDDVNMPAPHRHVQRRAPLAAAKAIRPDAGVHVRTSRYQKFHHIKVAASAGLNECVFVTGNDVFDASATFQKKINDLEASPCCGCD